MEIVLGGIGLLAFLILQLLCLALPFLIVAMHQTGETKRLLAFMAIFMVILPATVAADWYVILAIREVTRPGFG